MDPIDNFYQQLDSEAVLKQHGPELAAEARSILAQDPETRVAGAITMPDSTDATALRAALEKATGKPVPPGVLVGLVPRESVAHVLKARVEDHLWLEESWQPQTVLPVVVSTRDGFRFGFFRLA